MAKKQEDFLNNLLICDLVDSRKLAMCSNAKQLPSGDYGLCLLCLKEKMLSVYDTNFNQDVGKLLYIVDLTKIIDIKISTFIFNSYLEFIYEGKKYRFADFGKHPLLDAVKEVAEI